MSAVGSGSPKDGLMGGKRTLERWDAMQGASRWRRPLRICIVTARTNTPVMRPTAGTSFARGNGLEQPDELKQNGSDACGGEDHDS